MADSKVISKEVRCTTCGKVFYATESECPNCKTSNIRSKTPQPQQPTSDKFDEINDAERKKQMSRNKYGPKGLIILFITLVLSSMSSYGQNPQIKPSFVGNAKGIGNWFKNYYNPEKTEGWSFWDSVIKNKGGLVEISLTITKNGSVKKPHIEKGTSDNLLNNCVLSAISRMPNWSPAISANGETCESEIVLSVLFIGEGNTFGVRSVNVRWLSDSSTESQKEKKEYKWEQLTNHKTYEGEFSAFGLTKEYGKAKYQYIERPDGSRIFDGNFEFKGSNGFYAKGQFKNDYQVGQWEYSSNGRYAVINFDDDGYPNGNFVMYKTDSGSTGFPTKFGFKMIGDVCYGKLERGRFIEMNSHTSKNYDVIYYYDAYGDVRDARVTNSNTIKWEKYRGFYQIDNSTGDKETISVGEGTPVRTLFDGSLERYLLRSSAKRTFKYQRK